MRERGGLRVDVAVPHRHVHTHGPGLAPALGPRGAKPSGTLFFHLEDGATPVEKAELTETS